MNFVPLFSMEPVCFLLVLAPVVLICEERQCAVRFGNMIPKSGHFMTDYNKMAYKTVTFILNEECCSWVKDLEIRAQMGTGEARVVKLSCASNNYSLQICPCVSEQAYSAKVNVNTSLLLVIGHPKVDFARSRELGNISMNRRIDTELSTWDKYSTINTTCHTNATNATIQQHKPLETVTDITANTVSGPKLQNRAAFIAGGSVAFVVIVIIIIVARWRISLKKGGGMLNAPTARLPSPSPPAPPAPPPHQALPDPEVFAQLVLHQLLQKPVMELLLLRHGAQGRPGPPLSPSPASSEESHYETVSDQEFEKLPKQRIQSGHNKSSNSSHSASDWPEPSDTSTSLSSSMTATTASDRPPSFSAAASRTTSVPSSAEFTVPSSLGSPACLVASNCKRACAPAFPNQSLPDYYLHPGSECRPTTTLPAKSELVTLALRDTAYDSNHSYNNTEH